MHSTLERLENNRVAIKIEVPAQDLSKAIDAGYREVAKKINIPGFRKGKAPKNIILAYVGREPAYREALDKIVPHAYGVVVEEIGIDPIDYPEVNVEQFEEGKAFIFTATVQCMPEVTLGQYKGLDIEPVPVKVTEEDMEAEILNMRKRVGKVVPSERDVVELGDLITMDFVGKIEDEPFEGGTAENFELEVGSGTLIKGFEEQLVGIRLLESTQVSITFPEDYPSKDLAGTGAMFEVTVKSIKERELPEVDDDFAKMIGNFDNIDAMRDELKKRMLDITERRAMSQFENTLLMKISEYAEVDIPEVLIKRRVDALVDEFEKQLQYQKRTLKEYYEVTDTAESDLRDSLRDRATQEVKLDLVLDAITKAEGIEVTESDIASKVSQIAVRYKASEDKVMESLKRPEALANLFKSIKREKTVELLLVGYEKIVSQQS